MDPMRIPETVLLVEDDTQVSAVLTETLRRHLPMIRLVVPVSTLAEALSTLASAHVDLILLDLTLPDARGLQALRHIQQRAANVPVVIVTGDVDPDHARVAEAQGIPYVSKLSIVQEHAAVLIQAIRSVMADEDGSDWPGHPPSVAIYERSVPHQSQRRQYTEPNGNGRMALAHELAQFWERLAIGVLAALLGVVVWAFLDLKTDHDRLKDISAKRSEIIERLDERSVANKMRIERLEQYLYGRVPGSP